MSGEIVKMYRMHPGSCLCLPKFYIKVGQYPESRGQIFLRMHETLRLSIGDYRDDVFDHLPVTADFVVLVDDN